MELTLYGYTESHRDKRVGTVVPLWIAMMSTSAFRWVVDLRGALCCGLWVLPYLQYKD